MYIGDTEKLKESEQIFRELFAKYPSVSILKDLENQLQEIEFAYGMMSSCLVYGDDFKRKWFHKYTQYIPESKLEEMYEAYVDYFNEHVEVTKNVGTDSEGLTYHSSREI